MDLHKEVDLRKVVVKLHKDHEEVKLHKVVAKLHRVLVNHHMGVAKHHKVVGLHKVVVLPHKEQEVMHSLLEEVGIHTAIMAVIEMVKQYNQVDTREVT